MKIAWCEQSGLLQERREFERDLQVSGIDYFRFNWRHGSKDPFANVRHEGADKLSWSRGRQLLYEAAQSNNYDYYIFADDDLVLDRPVSDFIKRVRDVIREHQPCILTVKGDSWHEKYLANIQQSLVSIFVVDLQFQCLSSAAADFAFPVKFDGGWGTLWYPMLHCNKRRGSVLNIRDMAIKNASHVAGGEYGGCENQNTKSIWLRSEVYMPKHAAILSRILGHRKTILFLNYAYGKWVQPAKLGAK